MLPNNFDFQVTKERHVELIREAQNERLIAAAKQAHPSGRYYARRLSAWLGERMIRWGTYLVNLVLP